MDAIENMKKAARELWSTFSPFESITGTAAPALVKFAGVQSGHKVLDVGSGTGVVALTAARAGAQVTGSDLSPALLTRARENAALAKIDIPFEEADVENLPYPDESFDIVLSQFGHMFGPQPTRTTSEMLRVLKKGGTICFSTWPPELFTGRMFVLIGSVVPPPPEGASPPVLWGDPAIVRERLQSGCENIVFHRSRMKFPALSPAHMRLFLEANVGPVTKAVQLMQQEPEKLEAFRMKLDALISEYFENNIVNQDFLITRATKIK
jgi:SAM-dependent methyltransferase